MKKILSLAVVVIQLHFAHNIVSGNSSLCLDRPTDTQDMIGPRQKICVFTVRRRTLIFGPDPKLFYGTISRKLLKYPFFCLPI